MALLDRRGGASVLIRWAAGSALPALAVAFLVVLVWFVSLASLRRPRRGRRTSREAPWAEIAGDSVTIHNVRNFAWRTEADFTPRWETRTVDLSTAGGRRPGRFLLDGRCHRPRPGELRVQGRAAAGGLDRDQEGGRASPTRRVLGFFRRYELVYVVADERDLIGVRTNVRADPPEDVYLYHVAAPPENARRLFLEYCARSTSCASSRQFYNTATTNCTTMVLINNRVNGAVSLLNWKILLSGYLPQLVYERGGLDQTYPIAELRQRSRVNDAARAAGIESARLLDTDPRRACRCRRAEALANRPPRVHDGRTMHAR